MSDVPLALLQLRGTSHYFLKNARDRYGSIVRIVSSTLSYIVPSAWDDIYEICKNGSAASPKDLLFCSEMLQEKETITIASDEDTKPIRRAINPAFSDKALLEQESVLRSRINRLKLQLAKNSKEDGADDVRRWFNFSFINILSDFVFGEDLRCVRNGMYHEWAQFVVDYFYAGTLPHQCHRFWPLDKVLALLISPSVRDRKTRHSNASLQRVRCRIASFTDRPDFMFHFLWQAAKE
ncbi:MAG: hypothetical protein Q9190_003981 [Brigantiaea leucoxantha]